MSKTECQYSRLTPEALSCGEDPGPRLGPRSSEVTRGLESSCPGLTGWTAGRGRGSALGDRPASPPQACIDENFDMVKFLVENGADVNRQDNEGWTPLHAAASCGYLNIAE